MNELTNKNVYKLYIRLYIFDRNNEKKKVNY